MGFIDGERSEFNEPCVSSSGFQCYGCKANTKIWPSNGKRFAWFTAMITDNELAPKKIAPKKKASKVTCKFTIDNKVGGVWINGNKVKVTGDASNWSKLKTFSFTATDVTTLAIRGNDYENNRDGCQVAGLALPCSSEDSFTWNTFGSNTKTWIAYGSNNPKPPSDNWKTHKGDRSKFSEPCRS